MNANQQEYTITFLPANRTIKIKAGSSLIKAARKAGLHINASCGGAGVCGKCRVLLEEGEVQGGSSEKLSPEDYARGYRQACIAEVCEDATVRIPEESGRQKGGLGTDIPLRHHARMHVFDMEKLKEEGIFYPPVEKHCMELSRPDAHDNRADVGRLIQAIADQLDRRRMVTGLTVLRKIRRALREKDFLVTVTIELPVNEKSKSHLLNIQPGRWDHRNFGLAFDIGTTTVYGVLIDLNTGNILAKDSSYNPQMSYGEDVITRIIYAEKPEGLAMMHDLVVGAMNEIITRMLKKAGPPFDSNHGPITRDEINSITIAGNTTMTHLLLKLEPDNIRRSPYVPVSTFFHLCARKTWSWRCPITVWPCFILQSQVMWAAISWLELWALACTALNSSPCTSTWAPMPKSSSAIRNGSPAPPVQQARPLRAAASPTACVQWKGLSAILVSTPIPWSR